LIENEKDERGPSAADVHLVFQCLDGRKHVALVCTVSLPNKRDAGGVRESDFEYTLEQGLLSLRQLHHIIPL